MDALDGTDACDCMSYMERVKPYRMPLISIISLITYFSLHLIIKGSLFVL